MHYILSARTDLEEKSVKTIRAMVYRFMERYNLSLKVQRLQKFTESEM
jgi:hypothetical protein